MDRVASRRIQKCTAYKPHNIGIASLPLPQSGTKRRKIQRELAVNTAAIVIMIAEGNIKLTADNRLHTILRRLLRKFQRTEQIVGVRDCDGRRFVGKRLFDDLANGNAPSSKE